MTTGRVLTGLSPLQCALIKFASINHLECALTKLLDLKSFRIRTYKKVGVGPQSSCRQRLLNGVPRPGRRIFGYNRGSATVVERGISSMPVILSAAQDLSAWRHSAGTSPRSALEIEIRTGR